MPNLAVIEGLKKANVEILYIGSENGIEKKLIQKIGIRYEGVKCGKFRRYFSFQNFIDLFKLPVGIFEARKILKKFSPNVVFSKGGYVSVPTVIAAHMLKIPVIVHESDVSVGLANKICFRFADKICLSFEESFAYLSKKIVKKAIFTGMPIRENLTKGNKEDGYSFTGFDKYRPVILIMGGSQGANQINELVRASLDELIKKFQIVHITGKGNLDISVHKKGYVQYEFLDEKLKDIYAMCEMVISRGGANSLAELALLKKKVIIIPLGNNASRGEQSSNSRIFARKFGWSIINGNIHREDFINNILLTYKNELRSDVKFKNGLKDIVNLILKYK